MTTQPQIEATPERLQLAREYAAEELEGRDIALRVMAGERDDSHEVRSALLAIQRTEARMQAAVEAERVRLTPPDDVFDTAFVLQQLGRQAMGTDIRQVAAWVLSTAQAIRNPS